MYVNSVIGLDIVKNQAIAMLLLKDSGVVCVSWESMYFSNSV